jgi:hypothetical protein
MYAKYEYNSGATQANILADLVLILTGTTDVNSLSASCNKTTSSITATVASGWTVHDASAGSGKQVLKAAYVDNGSAYKFAELTVTSSELQIHVNETWNETAHTYTNRTGNTSYYQRWSSSNAGRFYLFSSARFLAIVGEYLTNYGESSYSGMTIVAELSRNQPWNTVGSGYPSVALVNTGECHYGNAGIYLPRAKTNLNNDVTGASAKLFLSTAGVSYGNWGTATSFPQGTNARVYDSLGNRQIPFFELLAIDPPNFVTWVGDLSTIADIWIAPKDLLAQLETVTKNSIDYVGVQANNSGQKWIFRKG